MNMFSHGVDPKLNFSNLPAIREKYENFTRMHVYERQPYAVIWYLPLSPVPIRMPLPKVWHGVKNSTSGLFLICG